MNRCARGCRASADPSLKVGPIEDRLKEMRVATQRISSGKMFRSVLDRGCIGDDNSLCTIDCAHPSRELITCILRSHVSVEGRSS